MEKLKEKYQYKEWLYKQYVDNELSTRDIAKNVGVKSPTILYWMKKFNIKRRTKSESLSGSKNPMYGKKHTNEVKKKISDHSIEFMKDKKEEWSKKFSGSNNPMYGKKHSEDSKKKMSEKSRTYFKSKPINPKSEMTRKKMSESAIKKFIKNPELKLNLSKIASSKLGSLNRFYGKTHSDESKKKISIKNRGRFRRENGSNWQGGITNFRIGLRDFYKYKEWRNEIFDRDKYTCKICNKKGGKLHVDHIVPFSHLLNKNKIITLEDAERCKDLWNIDNGRVLCVECHRKTDTFAGRAQKYKQGLEEKCLYEK